MFAYLVLTQIGERFTMPNIKLTKTSVDKLTPEVKEVFYWDTGLSGFGVRVKPNGLRSYIIQYRNRQTGHSKRKTIGQVGPLLSFSDAKAIASQYLGEVIRGGDPAEEAQSRRKAPKISDLADQYLKTHAIPKKRKNSVKMDISLINRFILPKLGKKFASEISHKDLQNFHNSLAKTPYQANRVLALLSKMFTLSMRWGWRTDNPALGINRFNEEKRHRWLTEYELKRLTKALDRHPNQNAANAIRLQLLTGARIGEVLNAEWQDFDLERGVWIKPSHHTKQKKTEHLPLSAAAVELVREIRQQHNQRFLFPSTRIDAPIQDLKRFWKAITKAAELEDYRIHDNRHTHASHLVSSGLSLAIVGRLLGHTNPMTTQRYAHLADDPLREAAEVMARKMGNT